MLEKITTQNLILDLDYWWHWAYLSDMTLIWSMISFRIFKEISFKSNSLFRASESLNFREREMTTQSRFLSKNHKKFLISQFFCDFYRFVYFCLFTFWNFADTLTINTGVPSKQKSKKILTKAIFTFCAKFLILFHEKMCHFTHFGIGFIPTLLRSDPSGNQPIFDTVSQLKKKKNRKKLFKIISQKKTSWNQLTLK